LPQIGTSEARLEALAEPERTFRAFVDWALRDWVRRMPTRVAPPERPGSSSPRAFLSEPSLADPRLSDPLLSSAEADDAERPYRSEASTVPFQSEAPTRSFVSSDRVPTVPPRPAQPLSSRPAGSRVRSSRAPAPVLPAHPSASIPAPAASFVSATFTPPGRASVAPEQQEVLLLTQKKSSPPPASFGYASVVPLRGDDTLKTEAVAAVPEVARVAAPAPPPAERSEDGHAPAHELDRAMTEMKVLLDYGHRDQVRAKIAEFCRRYPEDLLLLRRVAEFYLENRDQAAAMETLFLLASRLFERRNVEGMRRALEQVLVLDPTNKRAFRLLGLLDERPSTGTGG
jgi:hypothetical protein